MEKKEVSPSQISIQSNEHSIRDSNFKKDISLELVSKAQENETPSPSSHLSEIKEDILYQEDKRLNNKKSEQQVQKIQQFNTNLLGSHRQLFILEKKISSNLKLEIQQTHEQIKLLSLSILQNDIRDIKKAYLETEIQVRRMRIQQRAFRPKSRSNQVKQEHSSKKSISNQSRRKNNFLSYKKSGLTKIQGVERLKSQRREKNGITFLWFQLSNSIQERKKILKGKKSLMEKKIDFMKGSNQSKIELLFKQINLLKEERQLVKKSSSIICSEISKLTNSCLESQISSPYYVMSPKKTLKISEKNKERQETENSYLFSPKKRKEAHKQNKQILGEKTKKRNFSTLQN